MVWYDAAEKLLVLRRAYDKQPFSSWGDGSGVFIFVGLTELLREESQPRNRKTGTIGSRNCLVLSVGQQMLWAIRVLVCCDAFR